MIAPWVVYCIELSALFGVAALGLEYAARAGSWPTRWAWLAAVVGVVAAPVALNILTSPVLPPRVRVETTGVTLVPSIATHSQATTLDTPLLALWLLASIVIVGRIAVTVVQLRRGRARWSEARVDGEFVLLSDNVGPAVIGLTHSRTVMPRWALEFDSASRALMLRHESEHSRAGDPYLLAAAACALVALPWNPVLWLIVRRLRLAIEMDCDARVLAGGANPRTYASLLLAVGEKMSHTPFAWAVALSTPRSLLEKRIVAFTAPFRPRHPRLAVTALGAGVVLTLAIACTSGHPDQVTLSSPAAKGPSPQVAADMKSGAYATGGDTVVIEMSQRDADGPRGREYTRGPAGSMQYLYGRRPLLLRYPDGHEVVVSKGTSFQALLDDRSHDAPYLRASNVAKSLPVSPIVVPRRICADGATILVGADRCKRTEAK